MEPDCLMRGKMKDLEELNEYETFWHARVFMPAWEELKEKVKNNFCLIFVTPVCL